jgi:hypothetical protein
VERYTFVVRVHPGGTSTIENLATSERAVVVDLAAIGPQIELWTGELSQPVDESEAPPTEPR